MVLHLFLCPFGSNLYFIIVVFVGLPMKRENCTSSCVGLWLPIALVKSFPCFWFFISSSFVSIPPPPLSSSQSSLDCRQKRKRMGLPLPLYFTSKERMFFYWCGTSLALFFFYLLRFLLLSDTLHWLTDEEEREGFGTLRYHASKGWMVSFVLGPSFSAPFPPFLSFLNHLPWV